jgi:hypothetical protein
MQIIGHIELITHKKHKKTKVVQEHKPVPTLTSDKLFDYHQQIVPTLFKHGHGHTFITGGDFT